jgi:hypothetical protein
MLHPRGQELPSGVASSEGNVFCARMLDTRVMVPWIGEKYNLDVVACKRRIVS